MARPLRITYPGAFYHITSRGNERKRIFKSVDDREILFYFFYLESAARRYNAIIHVFRKITVNLWMATWVKKMGAL